MKTHNSLVAILLFHAAILVCNAPASNAGPYAIDIHGISNGGGQAVSASYNTTSSIGGIAGLSGDVDPVTIARSGYAGQLFDVDSVDVSADPEMINEGASTQLSAIVNLDDGTMLIPDNTSIQWSTINGPVTPPSPTGSVTAEVVYQNMFATLGGAYGGILGTKLVAILNFDPDNYGSYGSDTIDDDWQVAYFGLPPNPDADPTENPDSDPDDNLMEFLTGFDPTDPTQWFQFSIIDKTGSVATLQLNKVIPGRTYTIQAGTDLQDFPDTITVLNPDIEEADKIVTDTNATEQKKFYQVDVTRP